VDRDDFWRLVEDARAAVPDPADADAVAAEAAALPAERPREQIVAAQRVIWQLMADSYRTDPWAAAYHINGGCSDDGFDYFRGRLILRGRAVFERAVADPDSLADLPAVRAAAQTGEELESEAALGIAWDAHRSATGENLLAGSFRIRFPQRAPRWDFEKDFDKDRAETRRRLPRLWTLYERHDA